MTAVFTDVDKSTIVSLAFHGDMDPGQIRNYTFGRDVVSSGIARPGPVGGGRPQSTLAPEAWWRQRPAHVVTEKRVARDEMDRVDVWN